MTICVLATTLAEHPVCTCRANAQGFARAGDPAGKLGNALKCFPVNKATGSWFLCFIGLGLLGIA